MTNQQTEEDNSTTTISKDDDEVAMNRDDTNASMESNNYNFEVFFWNLISFPIQSLQIPIDSGR